MNIGGVVNLRHFHWQNRRWYAPIYHVSVYMAQYDTAVVFPEAHNLVKHCLYPPELGPQKTKRKKCRLKKAKVSAAAAAKKQKTAQVEELLAASSSSQHQQPPQLGFAEPVDDEWIMPPLSSLAPDAGTTAKLIIHCRYCGAIDHNSATCVGKKMDVIFKNFNLARVLLNTERLGQDLLLTLSTRTALDRARGAANVTDSSAVAGTNTRFNTTIASTNSTFTAVDVTSTAAAAAAAAAATTADVTDTSAATGTATSTAAAAAAAGSTDATGTAAAAISSAVAEASAATAAAQAVERVYAALTLDEALTPAPPAGQTRPGPSAAHYSTGDDSDEDTPTIPDTHSPSLSSALAQEDPAANNAASSSSAAAPPTTIQCLDCLLASKELSTQQHCGDCDINGFDLSQPAPPAVEQELIARGLWSGLDKHKYYYDETLCTLYPSLYSDQPSECWGVYINCQTKFREDSHKIDSNSANTWVGLYLYNSGVDTDDDDDEMW